MTIRQYRYPELAVDCADLAQRYLEASHASPEMVDVYA